MFTYLFLVIGRYHSLGKLLKHSTNIIIFDSVVNIFADKYTNLIKTTPVIKIII